MPQGEVLKFDIATMKKKASKVLPDWTRLDHKQCPNCPLSIEETTYCPAALDVVDIISTFKHYKSFQQVKVRVIGREREYFKKCDLQTAVNSLLGLVMANSECPYLSMFKVMSKYHLPFSSIEESTQRTLSFYLFEQFVIATKNGQPDWSLQALLERYEALKVVNTYFVKRINDYEDHNDAHINSVVRFFTLSSLIEVSMDKILNEVDYTPIKVSQNV